MTKKNIIFISISLVLTLLLGIGVSYSMWNITINQDTVSTMHTDCFELTISNKENNISLENAYPISNSKGIKLTPYTFTVTNTCDITAQYSINLEVLKNSTLSSKFIDVMLDGNINLLSSYDETDKIDNTSIESRKIDTGILKSNESKDYSLRLWMDYDTTLEDLNNETKVFKSKVTIVGKPINYTGDTVFNFDYTGGEQTFTVPVSGTYKLETWGAEGGYTNEFNGGNDGGGRGGYSNGTTKFNSKEILYLSIGGHGEVGNKNNSAKNYGGNGGYNGGGKGGIGNEGYASSPGGGGATHIATKTGLLSALENYKSKILIVSGGGGGNSAACVALGGTAGGFKSGVGSNYFLNSTDASSTIFSDSANQNYGYSFGKGSDGFNGTGGVCGCEGTGGGGGDYYGGFSYKPTEQYQKYSNVSGAGGSGYIGNSLLTNKIMYCYNCEESNEVSTKTVSTTCSEETPISYCAKKGNGYARITLASIDE